MHEGKVDLLALQCLVAKDQSQLAEPVSPLALN